MIEDVIDKKLHNEIFLNHRNTAGIALADNIGDSFLIDTNNAYRCIRERAIFYGIRFESQDTLLSRQYRALSLLALPEMYAKRVIPYVDNIVAFKMLDENYKYRELILNDATLQNPILHETGHVLGLILCEDKPYDGFPQQEQKIFSYYISEATAVACQCAPLTCWSSEKELFFLALNGCRCDISLAKRILQLSKDFSAKIVFETIMLASMLNMFGYAQDQAKELIEGNKRLKDVSSLVSIGYGFSPFQKLRNAFFNYLNLEDTYIKMINTSYPKDSIFIELTQQKVLQITNAICSNFDIN